MKSISFPKEEEKSIKERIKQNKSLFTVRVSKEQGKYKKGENLITSWGDLLGVETVKEIKNIKDYEHYDELNEEQKKFLKKFKELDVIKLIPINQQKVWDEIAPEWSEFKTKPAHHVMKFLEKQRGKILDLGSGAGRHLQKITKGKMYLVDFSEQMIKLAKKKAKKQKIEAEFEVLNLTKLPYKDNFFDSIICISALHCVEKKKDREKVVKEIYRILKPKAQALIGVWNKEAKRFKNADKEKYVKWRDKGTRYYYLYDKKEIHNLFKKNGFKIIEFEEPRMMINFFVEKI